MASWFKRGRSDEEAAESTIEVKAQVIADAVAAGQPGAGPAGNGPAGGIAADGVIAGGDFEAGLTAEEADAADGLSGGTGSLDGVADRLATDVAHQAFAERKSLVHLCLYALDRARSSGVAERIEDGLAAVGVTALRPDGQRFDPAHHEAGGTVRTEDEALDGVVAETEVVGFADRGEVLRAPIVTVYNRVGTS